MKIATHCKKTSAEINLYFSQNNDTTATAATLATSTTATSTTAITTIATTATTATVTATATPNIIYKCLVCNHTFVNKYTLKKHKTITRCTIASNNNIF